MVDGGSAGCMTYPGLRRFVVDQSSTRVLPSCTVLYCTVLYWRAVSTGAGCQVLSWLHIACHGLAGAACSGEEWGPGGEVDSCNVLKVEGRAQQSHPPLLVVMCSTRRLINVSR